MRADFYSRGNEQDCQRENLLRAELEQRPATKICKRAAGRLI